MGYDVIIVGARCAGAPTARLLAQRGFRVLLVDKATFPSDTICSHLIHAPGVARLRKWGLLSRLRSACCPPVREGAIDFGPVRLAGSLAGSSEASESYCVRRSMLDAMLVEAALNAGAEFRPAFTVQELLTENGTVVGVRGCTKSGLCVSERARITIGADGAHSAVARLLRASEYHVVEPLTCNYYTYWSGVPVCGAEWFLRAGRFCAAVPTCNGLTVITVLKPRAEFRQFRTNIEAGFLEALELAAPGLAERVRAGHREEGFAGTADTTNYFRRPFGPGWALAGDAGYHRDAITAQGISDAFRDADLLADAIDRGLTGSEPLDQALARYHAERDAAVAPMYRFTCELARLEPPSPERLGFLRALCECPAEAGRFLGMLAGTVPIPDFYASENVQQLLRQPCTSLPRSFQLQ